MRKLFLAAILAAGMAANAQAQISSSVVVAPGGAAAGDLSGTYPNPTVAKIGGQAISLGAPFSTTGSGTIVAAMGNSSGTMTLSTLVGKTALPTVYAPSAGLGTFVSQTFLISGTDAVENDTILIQGFDTANHGAATSNLFAVGLHLNNNGSGGGSGTIQGPRNTAYFLLSFDAPDNNIGVGRNYGALTSFASVLSNDNGTNVSPLGSFYGGATDIQATPSGADMWFAAVEGFEGNCSLKTVGGKNAHADLFTCAMFAPDGLHAIQGTTYDFVVGISNQSTQGTNVALAFGSMAGFQPTTTGGSLIASMNTMTVGNILDFSTNSVTASGYYMKFTSFQVDGNGTTFYPPATTAAVFNRTNNTTDNGVIYKTNSVNKLYVGWRNTGDDDYHIFSYAGTGLNADALVVYQATGNLKVAGVYISGAATGVNCTVGTLSVVTAVVTGGIITHC